MKIAYLVHNIGDPAVRRRVEMLRKGGAEVVLLGFQRDTQAPLTVEGVDVIRIGQSFDARMIQRSALLAKSLLSIGAHRRAFLDVDVLLARNLEMLTLAVRARAMAGGRQPIAYECLDVHRLLLGAGLASRMLRGVEQWLTRRCRLLLVSSPAFLSEYFEKMQAVRAPSMLIENKALRLDIATAEELEAPSVDAPVAAPPYRIGWFGMIRCQKSLDFLCEFVRRHPGLVEVVIRGRPSLSEFRDFEGQIAATPGVSFHGPYRAEDLASLYGQVHFAWAIDFFEAGLNSDWLLPNRLYEGGAHGCVPIALSGVETGRWLARHDCGLRLERMADLHDTLVDMTDEAYRAHRAAIARIPRGDLVATQEDCRDLTERLASLRADQ